MENAKIWNNPLKFRAKFCKQNIKNQNTDCTKVKNENWLYLEMDVVIKSDVNLGFLSCGRKQGHVQTKPQDGGWGVGMH